MTDKPAPKQPPTIPPPDAAFDLWLTRGLHALYDPVAQEPIPPDLLALIERDRKRRKKPGPDTG